MKNSGCKIIIITTPSIVDNEDTQAKLKFVTNLLKTIGGALITEKKENDEEIFKLALSLNPSRRGITEEEY